MSTQRAQLVREWVLDRLSAEEAQGSESREEAKAMGRRTR